MAITYIVYALCIILVLWGIKFSGFTAYHEPHMDISATGALRGLAAIGIILHHISQADVFMENGIISFFNPIGFYFVAIFFFISGYGLIRNLITKPGYMDNFLSRRLAVIIIPFYTGNVIYTVVRLLLGEKLHIMRIITGLLGFSLINEFAWYPIVLALLYLMFFLLFRREGHRGLKIGIMALFVLLMGLIFCVNGHFVWFAGPKNWWFSQIEREWWMAEKIWWFSGEWWVNSAIAFVLGMIYANSEAAIAKVIKKVYFILLPVMIGLAVLSHHYSVRLQSEYGYWSEWNWYPNPNMLGPGITDKIICYLGQIPEVATFTIAIFLILMKVRVNNPVLRFFSRYSYETYLMNKLAIIICSPLLFSATVLNMSLYCVGVMALTVIAAIGFKKLNGVAAKLFASNSTH